MQLVRTAQPKHKINLLSLSTEAGGPDVGHLVCSINSMQFVRTAQFKHKHLLALYSHSPRRTGGPQAPASGALVIYYYYVGCKYSCSSKHLNASRSSEHPPSGEKMFKGLGGNIGCRDKTSSWYQTVPQCNHIGSTV